MFVVNSIRCRLSRLALVLERIHTSPTRQRVYMRFLGVVVYVRVLGVHSLARRASMPREAATWLVLLAMLCFGSAINTGSAQSENPFGADADLEVQPVDAEESDAAAGVESDFGKPTVVFPPFKIDEKYLKTPKPEHFHVRNIEPTIERAPDDGVLVGIRLTRLGKDWHDRYSSIQAIYQVGDQYKLGQVFGNEGRFSDHLLAEPGFVVGGVSMELFAGQLKGAQLFFYPFDGSAMTVTRRKESKVIGDEMHRADIDIDLAQPIVGVHAYVDPRDTQRVESVLFDFVDLEQRRLEIERPTPLPRLTPPKHTVDHALQLTDQPSTSSTYHDDMAPEGGMLVGFRIHDVVSRGRVRTRSAKLEPLYQLEDRYVLGEEVEYYRDEQFKSETVRAKPGYAVCGLAFDRTALCQVLFARVDGEKLNMKDRYSSPRLFEIRDRSNLQSWKSPGLPIIGLKIRQWASVEAIALITSEDGKASTTSMPKLNKRGVPMGFKPIVRVWTSDRGKKVEATLMRLDIERNEVTIKKDGGKAFKLPVGKYSKEDQEFLNELERDKTN